MSTMFYALPAASAPSHVGRGPSLTPDEVPLLLSETGSRSSCWSYAERGISSRLLRRVKRMGRRRPSRGSAPPASTDARPDVQQRGGDPGPARRSKDADDIASVLSSETAAETATLASSATYSTLATTDTAASAPMSNGGEKKGAKSAVPAASGAAGAAGETKEKKKRDYNFVKQVGHAVILCMSSMYAVPAGAYWMDGRHYVSYATPGPICW